MPVETLGEALDLSWSVHKRVLKPEELVNVWRSAEVEGYPYGTVVQLLILTGQRRGEIAQLRWSWIKEKDMTITLPGSR
jgi:integrase